jgi:catechol 2,3-dioxygenase
VTVGLRPPGYRLPDTTHLGAVHLQVSDLARSLDYYEQILGLYPVARTGTSASLAPVGSDAALLHLRTAPGTRPVPRSGRLGLYHFALVVPDRPSLGRFLGHLRETGAHVASADHAVSEALYLWDPDQLGIEVYVDRPRSSWTERNGELFMTTERLDVRGLLAVGSGELWKGQPEGTVLGHMHLHVGDLDGAEAFYHRALGFDKTVWSYPGALFLSAGGYHHHLGTNTWAAGAGPAAADEARLLEWEIVLPSEEDCDAAASSCETAGYAVTVDERGRTIADPWGTRLRLVSTPSSGI